MNKKRWALLILCILLLAGYFKLYYKTWSNDTVVKNADCIVALDTKKITNTLMWDFITTPSLWKKSSIFSSSKNGRVSWDDMVKLPDYVFIFHPAGQPGNAWFTVAEINDPDDFNKGLQQFHFEKLANNEYFSSETGIVFIQNGPQLLIGNAAVKDKNCIRQVAEELFTKKQYISKEQLQQNIDAGSHLSAHLFQNEFVHQEYLIMAGFDKDDITFSTTLYPDPRVNLTENKFGYSDSSLCSLAFTQPSDVQRLLHDSLRANISQAVSFNIDSLLLNTNLRYQLDIEGIHQRIDSAISYTYDDDFNPVEKVVVNTVEEPAFNFLVQGVNVDPVYHYWKSNGKLEKTAAGELFTPMPFVRSYCSKKNKTELVIASNTYKAAPANHSVDCILFFKLLLTKLPSSILKYLPDDILKAMNNFESMELLVNYDKAHRVLLTVSFNKKKNDQPLISW